ncbi:MAG TPA: M56 family peptidase, partial [Candidatus Nocardiopsis merdipullorum]|nr:M56 family peptidase [Candidatus Nocardiopsis merdipullorum]
MSWSVSALVMVLLWSVATPRALRAFHRGRAPSARVMLALWMLATIAWLLSCVVLLITLATQMMGAGVKAFIAACVD